MDEMQSAKEHIARLRRSRHFGDNERTEGDANAQSLSRALDMLSKQLYSKPTHFILEMIQNADDNTYDHGVTPTLTMIYRDDGFLWVGCNEVGFTPENVSAICEIADSTKKSSGSRKGYIGEKGIGFKSVFKVAKTVWVSSGAYGFKFNRDDLLGMIVPIATKFKNIDLLNERTMFCLQIPKLTDRTAVQEDLLSLGADLLLFLRKLRHIHVRMVKSRGGQVVNEFFLHREDAVDDSGCTLTALTRRDLRPTVDITQENFVVFRSACSQMPKEEKREDITESEVIIAFPLPRSAMINRKTYNYLPIRDYGLPFLLQADFILTANRQDMVEDNDWNTTLKDHACKLFLESIGAFNKARHPNPLYDFKYAWPRFTEPTLNTSGTAMSGFLQMLRSKYLRNESILESQSLELRPVKNLVRVPDKFCDDQGRPLFDEAKHLKKFVHQKYLPEDLDTLGIKEQGSKDFCNNLIAMPTAKLHGMSQSWHSRLSSALQDGHQTKNFESAELIPIRDGRWVPCTEAPNVYFSDGDRIDVPHGIECLVLSDHVLEDNARKKFLVEKLGIKRISQNEVCKLILERHTSLDIDDSPLQLNHLVAHAWFLFKAKRVGNVNELKLAVDGQNVLARGQDLYMDDVTGGFQMSRFFTRSDPSCDFLHPIYLPYGEPDERQDWHDWLRHSAGVHTLPRLSVVVDGKDCVAPVFQSLIQKHPSEVWLRLLREYWDHYFRSSKDLTSNLGLGFQLVTCRNGQLRRLNTVYLPKPAIWKDLIAKQFVDFVDVNDPEVPGWNKLQALGLRTQPDLHFYVSILRAASANSVIFSDTHIEKVFSEIEKHSRNNEDEIRSTFAEEALIPINNEESTSWLTVSECRWTAPECLEKFAASRSHYPDILKSFFCTILGVQDASMSDLIHELDRKQGDMNNINNVRALILCLSDIMDGTDFTEDNRHEKVMRRLQGEIFPVRGPGGAIRLASVRRADWFIPDTARLHQCFQGRIWILDFADQEIKSLSSFFRKTGLETRYLSQTVVEIAEIHGSTKVSKALGQQLQSKAEYLALLAPADRREHVYKCISSAQGCVTKDILLKRHVTVNLRKIHGEEELGWASAECKNNKQLIVYCEEECLLKHQIPWPSISDALSYLFKLDLAAFGEVLMSILTTSDPVLIKDRLDRAGLLEEAYVPRKVPKNADLQMDDHDDEEIVSSAGANASAGGPNKGAPLKQESGGYDPAQKPSGNDGGATSSTQTSRRSSRLSGNAQSSSKTRPQSEAPSEPDRSASLPGDFDPRSPASAPSKTQREKQEPRILAAVTTAAEEFDPDDAILVGPTDGEEQLSPLELLQPSFTTADAEKNDLLDQDSFCRELFVFKFLQEHFEVDEASWTSAHRSRYDGALPDHGDTPFTLSTPGAGTRLTDWLIDRGIERANRWMGERVTFHIDVPTPDTEGNTVVFSAPQLDKPRQWRKTGTDIHIAFSVLDPATSEPKVGIYVEPLDLVLGGKGRLVMEGEFYLAFNE